MGDNKDFLTALSGSKGEKQRNGPSAVWGSHVLRNREPALLKTGAARVVPVNGSVYWTPSRGLAKKGRRRDGARGSVEADGVADAALPLACGTVTVFLFQ